MSDYMTAQFHEKVRELAVLRRELGSQQVEIERLRKVAAMIECPKCGYRPRVAGDGDPGPQRCPKSMAAVQAEVRQSRSQVSQPPLTPGETQ